MIDEEHADALSSGQWLGKDGKPKAKVPVLLKWVCGLGGGGLLLRGEGSRIKQVMFVFNTHTHTHNTHTTHTAPM